MLIDMIDNYEFDSFFKCIFVKFGDFYYVFVGIVYVIGLGILILEI